MRNIDKIDKDLNSTVSFDLFVWIVVRIETVELRFRKPVYPQSDNAATDRYHSRQLR